MSTLLIFHSLIALLQVANPRSRVLTTYSLHSKSWLEILNENLIDWTMKCIKKKILKCVFKSFSYVESRRWRRWNEIGLKRSINMWLEHRKPYWMAPKSSISSQSLQYHSSFYVFSVSYYIRRVRWQFIGVLSEFQVKSPLTVYGRSPQGPVLYRVGFRIE